MQRKKKNNNWGNKRSVRIASNTSSNNSKATSGRCSYKDASDSTEHICRHVATVTPNNKRMGGGGGAETVCVYRQLTKHELHRNKLLGVQLKKCQTIQEEKIKSVGILLTKGQTTRTGRRGGGGGWTGTDRETETETHRQRHTERQRQRQTERKREAESERERERERERDAERDRDTQRDRDREM